MKHIFLLNKDNSEDDLNQIIIFQAKKYISEDNLIFLNIDCNKYKQNLFNAISSLDIDENEYFILNPHASVLMSTPDENILNNLIDYLKSQDTYKYIRLRLLGFKNEKIIHSDLNLYEDSYCKFSRCPHLINKKNLLDIINRMDQDIFMHFWLSLETTNINSLFYFNTEDKDEKGYFFCKIYDAKTDLITLFHKWNVEYIEFIKDVLQQQELISNREFSEQANWECCHDMGKSS